MTLRIGIDFDNTIACYDRAFRDVGIALNYFQEGSVKSKEETKKLLLNRPDGERNWQSLQGQVYGRFIDSAHLFDGFGRFLMRCSGKNLQVFIISHKTKYGHHDKGMIPLRPACISWMTKRGFFDSNRFGLSKKQVFFADTRKEKVEKISELNLDVMIDDLPDVFQEAHFPNIKKILFSRQQHPEILSLASWADIAEEIHGPLSEREVKWFAQKLTHLESDPEIKLARGGRNSQVYQAKFSDKQIFCLKFYPIGGNYNEQRQINESNALEILSQKVEVPELICADKCLDISLMNWVSGKNVTKPTDDDIQQMIDFVKNLKKISANQQQYKKTATEACLSATKLIEQIELRKNLFEKEPHQHVKSILDAIFTSKFQTILNHTESYKLKYKIEDPLSRRMQILSPSDFGLHNSVKAANGTLTFLDFEYFGLDDPVKLLADTLWHPGMTLSEQQKLMFANGFVNSFREDKQFIYRLKAYWPLYGIRWCLILLNKFRDSQHMQDQSSLEAQYLKSQSILNQLETTKLKCPYVSYVE